MRLSFVLGAMLLGVMSAASSAQAGVKMFVRHEVSDPAAWRKSYNASAPTQREMGVTAQVVYQSMDNRNDVTVVHDFKSAELAKTFVTSDKLKEAMQSAGVKGAPLILITNSTPGATGKAGKAGKVRMFVHHQVTDYAKWRKAYGACQTDTASKKSGRAGRVSGGRRPERGGCLSRLRLVGQSQGVCRIG